MIHLENQGSEIAHTNYWETPHARRGFFYLSGNAGVWRLLVPDTLELMLSEMRTGQSASIEPSLQLPKQCWDVVFEDGSASPFSLALDKRQVDRALTPGACSLTVWTTIGKVLDLACTVKG